MEDFYPYIFGMSTSVSASVCPHVCWVHLYSHISFHMFLDTQEDICMSVRHPYICQYVHFPLVQQLSAYTFRYTGTMLAAHFITLHTIWYKEHAPVNMTINHSRDGTQWYQLTIFFVHIIFSHISSY